MVDFARAEPGQQLVERIEHDPNRSAHIALVRNTTTGKRTYILAAEGMRAGDMVSSYRAGLPDELIQDMGGALDMGQIASKTAYRGNCLKLGMIPVGTPIFNIAPTKDDHGKFARCAGTHGIIVGKGEDMVQKEMIKALGDSQALDLANFDAAQLKKFERLANYVTVKLSSGEIRLVDKEAVATIGVASNINHKYAQLGKAGRARWLGTRPTVRGTAMNTNDHPHGGGRDKSKGNKVPVSPWGVPVCQITMYVSSSANTLNRPNPATRRVQRTRSIYLLCRNVPEITERGGEGRHDCLYHRVDGSSCQYVYKNYGAHSVQPRPLSWHIIRNWYREEPPCTYQANANRVSSFRVSINQGAHTHAIIPDFTGLQAFRKQQCHYKELAHLG